jgi:type VI protein secretion system component Hcp
VRFFLRVDGFDGDSLDEDHKKWSDASDYRHAVRLEGIIDGRSPGSVVHDALVVVKPPDSTSAALFDAASRGMPLGKVSLEVCGRRISRDSPCFLLITLENATVSSHTQTEEGDSLSFVYEKIEWRFRPLDERGGRRDEVRVSWDLRSQRADGPTGGTAGDRIGYGEGSGTAFLVIQGLPGEATTSDPALRDPIGLTSFTRSLNGLHTTKGTDIATPALLTRLHRGDEFQRPTIRYGCVGGHSPGCVGSFEFDRATLMELSYGASQVERSTWSLDVRRPPALRDSGRRAHPR